ncbi:MAG TPA: hypothetical protein VH419_02255 [Nocardioidaceae bacterium]|jgi:hypothetical protein
MDRSTHLKSSCRVAAVVGTAALLTAGVQYHVLADHDHSRAARSEVSAALGADRIVALRESTFASTQSRIYRELASTSLTVPSGQHGLTVAHFGAESLCPGAAGSGYCSIRIRMDGTTEMVPQSGTNFAFDSASRDGRESHSMERTISGVDAGTHTFSVEWRLVCDPITHKCPGSFKLDDWVFDVEFWRQS